MLSRVPFGKTLVSHRKIYCGFVAGCIRNSQPCRHMDGWGMEIAVEREFYESDPQPVCNIVRNFLNKLTLERGSVILDNQGV